MEKELFFSGYCRTTDESRLVTALFEDSVLTDVDCCYVNCICKNDCSIAKQIAERTEENG